MRSSFFFLLVLLVILSVIPLISVPDSDGQDVDYKDPPAADNIISISMSCKSDDPTYHVELNDDYSDVAGDLAEDLGRAYSTTAAHRGTATEAQCTPSWISYDVVSERDYAHLVAPDWCVTLNISPALQQVAEDTHGDYWIWFKISSSGAVFTSGWDHTYLIKISLDVKWNGSVIVKDTVYHTYVLQFDSVGGSISQSYRQQFLAAEDKGLCYFDTVSVSPLRPGYDFKGWSTSYSDTGNAPLDVADDFPFSSKNADRVDTSDPNNTIYFKTLYAVWTPEKFWNSWDQLIELLLSPMFLICFALFVLVIAYFVRRRRLGGYY